jgi:hypothetical protein
MFEPQVGIESNAKKPRDGNFSIEEDILLVKAWINTGIHLLLGNEQSSGSSNRFVIFCVPFASVTSLWGSLKGPDHLFDQFFTLIL